MYVMYYVTEDAIDWHGKMHSAFMTVSTYKIEHKLTGSDSLWIVPGTVDPKED